MAAGDREDLPKLGLGAVGLGAAFLGLLPSIITHPFVKLVAAADTRKEARERFKSDFQGKAYTRIEDLCRDPQVEAVYIATPSQLHAEHVITAARYGKHIICEKPLALTIADGQAIIQEVERAGVKLVVGHTHSFAPPILRLRELIRSGEHGQLRMIHTFDYTDWIYRPRRPDELDTNRGGGVILRQVPHMADSVRLIAGGRARSVRAYTGIWDPARPTEGSMAAFVDFEDGAVATMVYSGYAHFDSDEFFDWIGEGGQQKVPQAYGEARRRLRTISSPDEEVALKASFTYGGANQRLRQPGPEGTAPKYHDHFGILIASCDKADIRTSPEGLTIYGDDEVQRVTVPFGRGGGRKATVLDELYDAVVLEKPLIHDGRWALGTLELCLAVLESSRERREVFLSHQTPPPA